MALIGVGFQKTIQHAIASRIRIDFKNLQEGKPSGIFGASLEARLQEKAELVMKRIAPKIAALSAEHYKESLDIVGRLLDSGLARGSEHATDFKAFSAKYQKHKDKYFPETARVFWKRSGAMADAFRVFAGNRKGAVSRTKALVKLHSKKSIRRGRAYRFTLDMAFTPIRDPFLDAVFRKAYFGASTSGLAGNSLAGLGSSQREDSPLRRLAFNESTGRVPRPFMTRLMAARGKELQALLAKRIAKLHT